MLPGTQDDDIVLARSPYAHVRARWILARPCPCPLDPRTHTLTGYARTHAPGPRTHAPGPCTLARTGSPRPLARGAHLARSHRVPTPAWSPCTHAPGPHARSRGPYASTHRAMHARLHRAMHARSHRAHARMLALGPHAHSHTGSPGMRAPGLCTCARPGLCMHACTGPMHARSHQAYARVLAPGPHACSLVGSPCTCAGCMLHPMYVVVVICSSTTVCILV